MDRRRRTDWGELPAELTALILVRVGCVEILRSARFVCSSWFVICKSLPIWREFDLRRLSVGDDFKSDRLAHSSSENLCRLICDYSAGQRTEIAFHGFGTDRLLLHIANRFSQLKCLRLFRCRGISSEVFCEAVAKFPLLEELEIHAVRSLYVKGIEAAGRFCPHLRILKLNHMGQVFHREARIDNEGLNRQAFAIAQNFSRLSHIEIRLNELSDDGLEALLDAFPHLDSLDLLGCVHIRFRGNLRERCERQVKHFRIPYDPSNNDYEILGVPDVSVIGLLL